MAATTTPGYANIMALAKQSAQGTANPISTTNLTNNTGYWLRWLQGSKVRPSSDMQQEWEGDGSRGQSLNFKKGQWGTGKLITYCRPRNAAMIFTAFSGSGSDAHSGSSAPYTHAITPVLTSAAYDYYTLRHSIGKGSSTVTTQVVDAVCHQIVVTAGAQNPPLKLDTDWTGLTNTQTVGSVTAASMETEGPFYWFNGTWTLASALAGSGNANWATAVQDISLTFAADLTPTDFVAEAITPLPFSPGNIKLTGEITLLWQDGGIDASAYFNGGSSDSATVATGDLSVTFACSSDNTQTLTIHIPHASWTMSDIEPDLSGKPVQSKASLVGLNVTGSTIYTVTVLNSANVGY
jgi:hypothetical protein